MWVPLSFCQRLGQEQYRIYNLMVINTLTKSLIMWINQLRDIGIVQKVRAPLFTVMHEGQKRKETPVCIFRVNTVSFPYLQV